MKSCPFCEVEASRIFAASDGAVAVKDAFPVTPGHALVIPRRHVNRVERNRSYGDELGVQFNELGVIHNLGSTSCIAHWAYSRAANTSGLTWHSNETLIPLGGEWLKLLV